MLKVVAKNLPEGEPWLSFELVKLSGAVTVALGDRQKRPKRAFLTDMLEIISKLSHCGLNFGSSFLQSRSLQQRTLLRARRLAVNRSLPLGAMLQISNALRVLRAL